jgi:S1-C subfamily serine protease
MNTMLGPRLVAATVIILAVGATTLFAQGTQTKVMRVEEGDIEGQPCEIAELGAIVVKKQGQLEVLFVMEGDTRPEAYREVDIRTGDIIAMANGKKMESTDALTTLMEEVAIGDPIKLGIKRDQEMMIVSYDKADPETLPKSKKIMMSDDGHGEAQKVFQSEGGVEGEVVMLVGSGIIAKAGEGGPVVGYLMPHAKELAGDIKPVEGDRIVSMQGETVETLDALSDAFDAIAVGDKVEMVLARDGKEFKFAWDKSEGMPGGAMMITK